MVTKMGRKRKASESKAEIVEKDDRFALREDDEPKDDHSAEEGPSTSLPINPIKKKKHGIIYVSSIPKYMTVSLLREFLGHHAAIGRIYLQVGKDTGKEEGAPKKKKRKLKYRTFTEGWVEFLSKKAAKAVAAELNGKPITTRKKSKFCDILWNIKYLPRFKWMHLSERLTYEKMVYQQRMRNEISQARKEANRFSENLAKSEFKKKKKQKVDEDD